MNRSIFAIVISGALLAAAPASSARAAEEKIAFVDLQRALEETKDGQAAKSRLKSDFDKKQKELDEKQEELKKAKEDFDKKSAMMKEDAKNKAASELQQRFMQLQEIFARLQKDLASKEQEATRGILTKLQGVVQKIAEREHFQLVLERSSSVVYGQPSLDITNEVIRTYNAQSGGGKSK